MYIKPPKNRLAGEQTVSRTAPSCGAAASAFTLIEMLLALAVSAIVLAGISGVFYSALRLRERTTALLEKTAPLDQAIAVLRRDLRNALPPSSSMAGDFRSGALSGGMGRSFGLEFSTTTGQVGEEFPWGDVQDVIYELRDAEYNAAAGRKDLVRSIARNILSPRGPEWESRVLLNNVQQMEVYCWNGADWETSWDTSLYETNLPAAVKVSLLLADDDNDPVRSTPAPIELLVTLACQARGQSTNSTTSGGSL